MSLCYNRYNSINRTTIFFICPGEKRVVCLMKRDGNLSNIYNHIRGVQVIWVRGGPGREAPEILGFGPPLGPLGGGQKNFARSAKIF